MSAKDKPTKEAFIAWVREQPPEKELNMLENYGFTQNWKLPYMDLPTCGCLLVQYGRHLGIPNRELACSYSSFNAATSFDEKDSLSIEALVSMGAAREWKTFAEAQEYVKDW